MFNLLENIMQTDLNLSNSDYLKGPRHLVSLMYRLRVNGLKTKYCKDVTCSSMVKFSTTHILFNCQHLNIIFRTSDLYPNSTINTFPTGFLYHPNYFVPLGHLLLKSNWPAYFNLRNVCLCNACQCTYAFSCVCIS